MIVTVLGSGSNGGVPQWDCCCDNCTRARTTPGQSRTRSSVAVSIEGGQQVLFDATPDLKFQLEKTGLTPKSKEAKHGRQSRIEAIFLTHGHGDHTVGIAEFSTGKSFSIPVYAPPDLIGFMFGSQGRRSFFGDIGRLARNYVKPIELETEKVVEPLPGLKVSGFLIDHTDRLEDGSPFPSSTYGYEIEAEGKKFVYSPDIGLLSDDVLSRVKGADLYMLDATFWWDNELARISGLEKTSYDLGHVPVEESIKILQGRDIRRVVYTHINHTNPLLNPAQPIASILVDKGFEAASDGMRIEL
jgi:pyrroloquinoline quinone biosynthesis protein B